MRIIKITSSDIPSLGVKSEDGIRQLRGPLLDALDVYDKLVLRDRIIETPEEKEIVDKWWERLCNLDLTALDDIPEKVKKHIK